MKDCKSNDNFVNKGDKFSLSQCHKKDFENKDIQKIMYTLAMRSLIYAQVCMHLDIMYIVGMLDRYLSNLRMDH